MSGKPPEPWTLRHPFEVQKIQRCHLLHSGPNVTTGTAMSFLNNQPMLSDCTAILQVQSNFSPPTWYNWCNCWPHWKTAQRLKHSDALAAFEPWRERFISYRLAWRNTWRSKYHWNKGIYGIVIMKCETQFVIQHVHMHTHTHVYRYIHEINIFHVWPVATYQVCVMECMWSAVSVQKEV